MVVATSTESTHLVGRSVFSRVLVGVDGSTEALEAVRQAARLRSTETGLALLAAWENPPPRIAGFGTPVYSRGDESRLGAEQAVTACLETLDLDELPASVVRASASKALISEVERRHHTLVAVGAYAHGRVAGIAAGSTATELLHNSPCSVLVARSAGPLFPSRICLGDDGSPEAALARAAAEYLAHRFGTDLRSISARSGTSPVGALVRAGADADLLVVGSRGLHGLRALGSVSERVAHEASCSVLVVRYRSCVS